MALIELGKIVDSRGDDSETDVMTDSELEDALRVLTEISAGLESEMSEVEEIKKA